jgi:hypothetical protein
MTAFFISLSIFHKNNIWIKIICKLFHQQKLNSMQIFTFRTIISQSNAQVLITSDTGIPDGSSMLKVE